MKELKAEMLMVWGRQDPHVPTEGRALIQRAMIEAGVHFTWHEFNGAHAFLRDEGPRYDPALALTCYRLAIDLFKRKLTDGDLPVAATGGAEARNRG
jgi:carboxymethylenebutenolidase